MNKLIISDSVVRTLEARFRNAAPNEDGAFCLVRRATTAAGARLLVSEVVNYHPEPWDEQDWGRLQPSARAVSAAVSAAVAAGAGLLFVHSHPSPAYPTGFSAMDYAAFRNLARALATAVDGPFCAAVAHPDGWVGYWWSEEEVRPLDAAWAVGHGLCPLSAPGDRDADPLDERDRSALGVAHDHLKRLSVALVGCGGLGAPLGEVLVRSGVRALMLIDHDRLDTPSNVRRVMGSRREHLLLQPPPTKVDVLGDHLDAIGLQAVVRRIADDVRDERVLRQVGEADVIVCATDTHGSRASLNQLALAFSIPLIDVGVRVGRRGGGELEGLVCEVRRVSAATPCLWCSNTLSGGKIREENLPAHERELLQQEGYAVGRRGPEPSTAALTVLGAGHAACALLGLLGGDAQRLPVSAWFDGLLGDARRGPVESATQHCICRDTVWRGDAALLVPDAPRRGT